MKEITLGSLFDGIGGFPLSGAMHGIKPVWASEIEPFPILTTVRRFPKMRHLGSVTDIRGDEIEPVDILTFGSPCQDLSVAGAQKGIHEGKRSNLFFQAIRIIKEMRDHDRAAGRTGVDVRCRWAVWENVPGAFSSNKGRDFQAVLQALCEVADPEVHIPFPEKGKWQPAGCIVGDGYSVAWRVYDAQYWGVTIRDGGTGNLLRRGTPQRRKRIYLVADFASERAGEILFERESMSGDSETSGEARQGTAEDAQGGAGGSGGAVCYGICSYDSNSMRSGNPHSGVYEADTSRTLDLNGGNPSCNQGGIAIVQPYQDVVGALCMDDYKGPNRQYVDQDKLIVYCLQGNGIDRADTAGCNGKGWREGGAYTLNTIDRHAVVYDARGNGEGGCHQH